MKLNATLIFEVISFLVLAAVLARYAYGPLLKFLDERAKNIRENLDSAEESRMEAEKNFTESRKELEEARKEALCIKEENKRQSEEAKEKILREAEERASSLVAQTRQDILKETEHAKASLRAFIADASVSIASKILNKEIKAKEHIGLFKKGIEDLKEDGNG